MPKSTQQTYQEFEEQLELLRKFGPAAVQKTLDAERKKQGLGEAVTRDAVLNAVGQTMEKYMDAAYQNGLKATQTALRMQHTPRADSTPELTNEDKLQAGSTKQQARKPHPLFKDLASDANSAAINQIINNPRNGEVIATQFNEIIKNMENELRNQHKLRMAMAPRPGKKIEPKPH